MVIVAMKFLLGCITVHLCLGHRPLYPPLRQRVVSFHLDNRASMADSGSVVSHVSKVKCTLMCFESPSCISVFYWKSEGKCRTNAAPQTPAEHPREGKVNREDAKSKVNRQDPKGKVNRQDPKSKVNRQDPKGKVNRQDPKGKVNRRDPQSKVNRRDPKGKVNRQDPKGKVNRQDPKGKVNRRDPQSKVNRRDPKGKVNRQDPKGKDYRRDPQSKVNRQDPKSNGHYAVLRNVTCHHCENENPNPGQDVPEKMLREAAEESNQADHYIYFKEIGLSLIHHTDRKGWHVASHVCLRENGLMFVIDSQKKQDAAKRLVKSSGHELVFIGVYAYFVTWRYEGTQRTHVNYSSWAPREPHLPFFAALGRSSDYLWVTTGQHDNASYICERK